MGQTFRIIQYKEDLEYQPTLLLTNKKQQLCKHFHLMSY